MESSTPPATHALMSSQRALIARLQELALTHAGEPMVLAEYSTALRDAVSDLQTLAECP